ncbi:hypothetical protein AEA09_18270 [Lysinibacillus contaminans]|uniref:Spore protein YkvP/CgeB glycosyl transferase-like domain-containing protein n=1 Tax=Lysinibacillus contaminans TaxID=1293441 RepID=A0ABR5JXE6_9BACI|nr:glycosyltransferase family 1 protein [Lysinibacillus contaminans]KOS66679.1 hypothetical protein AEA09_18270 [Lysinibacillus contaminans]
MDFSVKKVGIIRGMSQYDVMRSWTLELEKGFNKLGIEVTVYDLKYHHQLRFADDIDFYVSVNGWGLPDLTKIIQQPIIMYLADHANDHIERILSLRSHDILTVVDRFDFKILEGLGVNRNAYFLPHAALEVNYLENEKEYDLVFLGSYSSGRDYLESLKTLESSSPILFEYYNQILKVCLEDRNVHYLYDGLNFLENKGVSLNTENSHFLISHFINIGRYIYSKEREQLLLELARKGYNIEIFGNGWGSSQLTELSNVNINESVNYYESQKLISKAKILINAAPFLRDGSHERAFAGIANNTYVLSNYSAYLDELNNPKILFYNLKELNTIYSEIDKILSKNNEEFYDKALLDDIYNNHTFEKRAKHILEIFMFHKEKVIDL